MELCDNKMEHYDYTMEHCDDTMEDRDVIKDHIIEHYGNNGALR